ncbi:MAG: hypothetical protein MZV70_30650 [Desulfobacterales bacterium]|nr:hypothetical protein [Desulfobacterales bacterium]
MVLEFFLRCEKGAGSSHEMAGLLYPPDALSLHSNRLLAADITLTAGQQDYYFLTGQPVEIPLAVASTKLGEIPVNGPPSTDAHLQKGRHGDDQHPRNQVFPTPSRGPVLPESQPRHRRGVLRDYKVHVSFYQTALIAGQYQPAVKVPHPRCRRSGLAEKFPLPLASTGQPSRGEIPSKSSVSAVEQTVSIRQQIGSGQPQGSSRSRVSASRSRIRKPPGNSNSVTRRSGSGNRGSSTGGLERDRPVCCREQEPWCRRFHPPDAGHAARRGNAYRAHSRWCAGKVRSTEVSCSRGLCRVA